MFTSPNRRESTSTDLSSYSLSYNQNSSTPSSASPQSTGDANLVQDTILPPLRFQSSTPSAFDLLISTAAYQWDLLNSDKNSSTSSIQRLKPASTLAANDFSHAYTKTTSNPSTNNTLPANIDQQNAVLYSYSYQVVNPKENSSNNVTVTKTDVTRKRSLSEEIVEPQQLPPKKSPKLDISNLVSAVNSTEGDVYQHNNMSDASDSSSDASITSEKKKDSPNSALILKLCSPSNAGRQRSGPSCDCCRARKIKCDAEIIILPEDAHELIPSTSEKLPVELIKNGSKIANCEFIAYSQGHQFFKISHPLSTPKYSKSNYAYLKFKQCQACSHKEISCCFSRGITRNDIARYNKVEKKKKQQSDIKPERDSSDGASPKEVSNSSESFHETQDKIKLETEKLEMDPSTRFVKNDIQGDKTQEELQVNTPATSVPSSHSESSSVVPNYRRSSCSSCRSKKIKCFKVSNEAVACSHCIKKGIQCIY